VTRRIVYVAVGLCAFAVAVADATVGVVPLALGRPVVNVVAVVALAFVYWIAKRRWHGRTVERDTPDPELAAGSHAPGSDLRAAIASVPGVEATGYSRQPHEDLRAVAEGALRRYTPRDESAALAAVRDGTWTDDAAVLAFLDDGSVLSTPGRRLRRYVTGESARERAVRDTVTAIARVAGTEGVSTDRRLLNALLAAVRPDDPDRGRTVRAPGGRRPTGADHGAERTTADAGEAATSRIGSTPGSDPDGETDPDAGSRGRATGRWRGVGALGMICVAVGVVSGSPGVVLGAVVVVAAVAYGRTGTAPPIALRVERTVDEGRHEPGEPVTVTVRVHNESDALLSDLRIVDGVPEALSVESGSPRHATALRPGSTATWSYAVTARRGRHEFGSTMVVCRDLAGTAERVGYVHVAAGPGETGDAGARGSATSLVCRPSYRQTTAPVPLRRRPALGSGPVTTDVAGSGVEFDSTREYRPGDPPDRIDWNRLARTGTLGTTEFREERVATVVLVVDARQSAYCSPGTDGHALDRSVDAAGRVAARLFADGHRVGFATFGPDECWLPPGTGAIHADRLRDALATDEAVSPLPSSDPADDGPGTLLGRLRSGARPTSPHRERQWRERLVRRLSPGAQAFVCSPLVDDGSARLARELEAREHPVTVVSPDPTATGTPGEALARIGRRFRVTDLRRTGVPVVDWGWTDSLDATLERYAERGR